MHSNLGAKLWRGCECREKMGGGGRNPISMPYGSLMLWDSSSYCQFPSTAVGYLATAVGYPQTAQLGLTDASSFVFLLLIRSAMHVVVNISFQFKDCRGCRHSPGGGFEYWLYSSLPIS